MPERAKQVKVMLNETRNDSIVPLSGFSLVVRRLLEV